MDMSGLEVVNGRIEPTAAGAKQLVAELRAERDAARLACARFLLFFRSFDGVGTYREIVHPAFDAIKAEALQAAIPVAQKELLA